MEEIPAQEITSEHSDVAKRIAFSLLRRWRCQINRDDVEGMAGVAVVRAAQQFDPTMGTKFESFLFYYVKAELIKAIEGAVSARKAVDALRDVVPEFDLADTRENEQTNDEPSSKILPDPDRIAAPPPVTPEGEMLREECHAGLHTALARLEEQHRKILEMVYFKQVSPDEIKSELGLTRSGIKRALARARKALEKELLALGIDQTSFS